MKTKSLAKLALLIPTVSILPGTLAQAPAHAPPLRSAPTELIIKFNSAVTDGEIADAFGKGRLKLRKHVQTPAMRLNGEIGLTRVETSLDLNAALEAVNGLPGVDFAEPNLLATMDAEANDPYYADGSLWGMYGDDLPSAIGPAITSNKFGSQAEKAWAAGFIGSPDVYVGLIDTGFEPDHPDLLANVWTNPEEIPGDGIDNDGDGYIDDVHGWNSIDGNGVIFDPTQGHGTHVAGTIGATGGNDLGVIGMNWNVKLIAGRCAGANGVLLTDAIEAIDYMTALKTIKGLNIVALNNSYSGGGSSQALQDALSRAAQAGILAVCSASNQGMDNDASPRWPAGADTTATAGYDSVICVAAIDKAGARASFSNYGASSVDLGAPGVDILSTVPGGTYSLGSGTSMSTPHVTGAIALFASVYPNTSGAEIKQRLLTAGVVDTPSMSGATLTGGRLDVYRFITTPATVVPLPAAPSGLTATVPKAPAKGTINLAWTDRSTNEKGFILERKTTSAGAWQSMKTVAPNTRSFSDTSGASRTTYFYRVKAFNVGGSSAYSNEVSASLK